MLKSSKNIFLVGAGGIGISALGRILLGSGKQVSGSDTEDSQLIKELKADGISIVIGHREENLPEDTDVLIYSHAVPENNPERKSARDLGIRELSYPQALGEILKDYYVVAVTGTNGKTTTTAMLASVLEEAGFDPTVLVGSKMKSLNSNARVGESKYFIVEADEYKRGFLNYAADVAVITNIKADHLDYFKDEKDVKKAFSEFVEKINSGGVLVFNQDDKNSRELAEQSKIKKVSFGFSNSAEVNLVAMGDLNLKLPGRVNQANAMAAAAAATALDIPIETIRKGLEKFEGTWRRFDLVGKLEGADIISDYAHHPDGVRGLLAAAQEVYGQKKVLIVYQPHQHNRTKMLFDDFVTSFCKSGADDILFVEIFDVPGREEVDDQDVSAKDLADEVSKCKGNVWYAKDLKEAEAEVRKAISGYGAVFIVGAGDIYLVAERLVK